MNELIEESFGYIVVNRSEKVDRLLIVKHADAHWSFPKGHAEGEEHPASTARRELAEETGLTNLVGIPGITFSEMYTFERKGIKIEKKNIYFLAVTKEEITTPQAGEILECRWCTYLELQLLQLFPEMRRMVDEVFAVLPNIART